MPIHLSTLTAIEIVVKVTEAAYEARAVVSFTVFP